MFATVTSNHVKVAGVVLFYMSSALVMVFVNKAVLNSSPELPLLFLLLQLMLAVILLHLAALVSDRVEIPKLEVESAKKLTPVILVNVIGLVFNTLCLRDVEASFFQIARGLVLPLTIIVSSLNTHTTPTSRTIFAAVIVTVGFLLGVAPSAAVPAHVAPSILSLFYGVLSSLFIALHAVFIKSSLPHCGNSTIQLAYWTNAGSVIFLAPFIIFNGELVKLRVLTETPAWNGHIFLWGSLITGVFGFLLCVAGLLSIKVTSPITHMFSSAARSVLQTILGVWLFNDTLTTNRASSIFVILLGTMYFTWVKSQDSAPPQQPKVDVEAQEIMKRSSRDSESDTVVWEVPEKESKD